MLALLGGLAALLPGWRIGDLLFRRYALPFPVLFGLGCGVWSIVLFFIFQLGVARWWVFAAAAAFSLPVLRTVKLQLPDKNALWFLPFGTLYVIHAFGPEVQPDAVAYHLGLAREWVRTGGFDHRVGQFEIMPHAMEVLFAAAYSLGAHPAAKLVHFAFLVATPALMVAIARKLGFDGLPAAVLYFVTPVVGVCGTSAYVDVALAFFALTAFYLVIAGERRLAGLAAGFCYGVKLTGILAVAAAVVGLAQLGWMAMLPVLPWMARAWWMSGNPVAPLLNGVFANPYFHTSTERSHSEYVSNYGVPWREFPWELAVGGARLEGIVGPVVLLAIPVALLALGRRPGRWLWMAAMLAAVPWWFNAGARFLIPAVAFLLLALCLVLPRRLALTLAVAHGILSWPSILDLYTPKGSWHLAAWPPSFDASVARMIAQKTFPGQRILDLAGAPQAYFDAVAMNHWQYAQGDRAADALEIASGLNGTTFVMLGARWPETQLAAIRLEPDGDTPSIWSFQEIEIISQGKPLFPSRRWSLDANPNPWEAGLALDGNGISRWQSWTPRKKEMFYEIDFAGATPVEGIRAMCLLRERTGKVRVLGRGLNGSWSVLSAGADERFWIPLNLRQRAIAYVKREGFQYVLTRTGTQGLHKVGMDLVEHPSDWGIERLGVADGNYLLKLK